MKIYVASSWRNEYQPGIVNFIRSLGHQVYDFRKPNGQEAGFHWSDIDVAWTNWTPEEYRQALTHPLAVAGFQSDLAGMVWADAVVLVLPSGRSSHSEAAHEKGKGKPVVVYIPEPIEPELMYKLFDNIVINEGELAYWIGNTAGKLQAGTYAR